MKLLAAGLLLAAVACAQQFEIRGSITEPGVGGIPGIPLTVSRDRESGPSVEGGVRILRGDALPVQAATDARGNFRISVDQAGLYSVMPVFNNRAYYPLSIEGAFEGSIRLDAAHPQAEVRFSFGRYGQITGLVLDEETRQPVPDYSIVLYDHGPQGTLGGAVAVTNRDGRFTLTEIRPGEHVVGTRLPPGRRHQSADARDPHPEELDSGYAETFWPGGASDAKSALPVRLTSGGIADVGTIVLHKIPRYKIHVSVPQGECPENESVRVMLLQSGATEPVMPPNVIRCGEEGWLRDFDPGSYTLYAVSDWQGEHEGIENAVWASTPVVITDKNQDVTLTLQRGVVLEGRIKLPEGTVPPAKHLMIAALPAALFGMRPTPIMEQFIEWTSDTTFHATVHASSQLLSVPGVVSPGPLYVKEIRYNGALVRNDIVPVSSGAGAQSLEIVMDDKPTVVSGTLTYGTAPPRQAVAVLERSIPSGLYPRLLYVPVAANGQFQFQGVRPGDYRIFAISASDRVRLQTPGVLERLMAGAEKITVAPGVSETVTLRLSEIGR